ncbi:sigma-70 family RNA polymerase sigma factor [Glycomyces algeriensis]|uniref:DNA-directed RNA polymerase sigma-70 factor n=1 Tax=Glycomyces algeriensis TaxID=256037 RepID=A0A9W6GC75_9ACTN|nr:sigma-70 family RNA polymerase sigma factor [Glycomyces algeriensis]MDA1365690.1 sigma-70 family RNA polymerase sigma factor [Glycomyces algeriensis]MDR7351378.1 RNA polymerase sigma-70 factor (ECF subfamily) [Glycomyces algeriensis]GLI44094.1 DNA-directed RNA polymerase sigma-70 factor [Glycomyces algeriensis]
MTESGTPEALAGAFEQQRERLVAVAHRMLGSRADAEDAVQEAWIRLARQDQASIDNLAGWLTTVVGRVCLDVLRSRKTRAEQSYEDRLPELVVAVDGALSPEDDAMLAESVGLALLVVLETLTPTERLAFVLHDMFAVSFAEIGEIIGRSTDASKMLASRARRKVRAASLPPEERGRQRAVVDAFLAAARDGDFEALVRLMDPQVTWRTLHPQGLLTTVGAAEVAGPVLRGMKAMTTALPVMVNGEPGFVAWGANGKVLGVAACTVVDGRIVELLTVSDRKRLDAMGLPARPD